MVWINPLIAVSIKTRLPEGYCKCMCSLCPFFLMPPGGGCTDCLGPPSLLAAIFRAQASKAQGPIDFLRIINFFLIYFFYSTIRVLLRALTCSKTLENSHTRWNPLASGRHRGWDPGVAQGLYGAPRTQSENLMYSSHILARIHMNSVHI